MALEKAKSSLESANAELTAELKQATNARQEAERRRKLIDGQLQETSLRAAELDRANVDLMDKVSRLQVYNFTLLPKEQSIVFCPGIISNI